MDSSFGLMNSSFELTYRRNTPIKMRQEAYSLFIADGNPGAFIGVLGKGQNVGTCQGCGIAGILTIPLRTIFCPKKLVRLKKRMPANKKYLINGILTFINQHLSIRLYHLPPNRSLAILAPMASNSSSEMGFLPLGGTIRLRCFPSNVPKLILSA